MSSVRRDPKTPPLLRDLGILRFRYTSIGAKNHGFWINYTPKFYKELPQNTPQNPKIFLGAAPSDLALPAALSIIFGIAEIPNVWISLHKSPICSRCQLFCYCGSGLRSSLCKMFMPVDLKCSRIFHRNDQFNK